MEILNNREWAIIIWSTVILCYLLFSGFKKSFKDIFAAIFQTKLISPIVFAALYTTGIIFILDYFLLWDISLLKDTIIWFFVVGVFLLFKLGTAENQSKLFKKVFLENLKLLVIVEFIANFYSFPLLVELVIIPLISIILMMEVVAKRDPKYSAVSNLLHWIQVVFGYVILFYAIYKIATNYEAFFSFQTLNSFLFPIILSILYSPFLYFFILYVNYEMLFTRLKMGAEKSRELKRAAKKEIFKNCLFSIKKTKKARNMSIYNIMRIRSLKDIEEMSKIYKTQL